MRALVLLILASTTFAHAQPEQTEAPADAAADPALRPVQADEDTCKDLDLTPGALLQTPSASDKLATPIPWSEFEIQGRLVDSQQTVRALLEPTMEQFRTSLSIATMPQLARMTARYGYQIVGHSTQESPKGIKLTLHLAPLPIVRKVDIDVNESIRDKYLEDEVGRRLGVRVGSLLPWDPIRRQCVMLAERNRITEYLGEEAYYDAEVSIVPAMDHASARILVKVILNDPYKIGVVTVNCPAGSTRNKAGLCVDPTTETVERLEVPEAEIREIFAKPASWYDRLVRFGGRERYTLQQHLAHIQTVKRRFQKLGYPSVRVVVDEPRRAINKNKKTINPTITIDPRRKVEVRFEGYDTDAITESQLRARLTFDEAGSADEVEVTESAKAITTYLQTRGYYDVLVTSPPREARDFEPPPGSKVPASHLDIITFQISTGPLRRIASIEFDGNKATENGKPILSTAALEKLVDTKAASLGGVFFGSRTSASSEMIINDQEKIKEAYRKEGFLDAHVWASVSTSKVALDNAALTAALLGLDDGDDLHVKFSIAEGQPTLLTRIALVGEGGRALDDELCQLSLEEIARVLDDRQIATRADKAKEGGKCVATIAGSRYRADRVAESRPRLEEALHKAGRARAQVELTPVPFGIHRIEARYMVTKAAPLKLGKVVIRGNFRTRSSLIYDLMDLEEGAPLTTESLVNGARRLRNSGLFDSVNPEMPDLDCERQERACNSSVINLVLRVEERYDHFAEIGVEVGVSTLNGLFGTVRWAQRNLWGRGITFELSGTAGTKLAEVEARLRLPAWLYPDWFGFSTELSGLYRRQDTQRFGELTTQGATLAFSRVWTRKATASQQAYTISLIPSYDFRLRQRNVDAVRPVGADRDESQIAVSTRTGSVGLRIDWDQRVDQNNQLAQLAPQFGHRLDASASFAAPYFLGQDKFVKLSLGASKFYTVDASKTKDDKGTNLLLRADFRADWGIPLGDAVLLPEVERFFAGGDGTVRGYADERLATELIQVGVPPLENISQIRVNPAGGNIRLLGSVDAQLPIWKVFAGALFADAGLITNQWNTIEVARKYGVIPTDIPDLRPSVGMGLRAITQFGIGALEYAVPVRPQLGDDPRGRIHFYFAARAQF